MNQTTKHPATWRERGQSLVEVALFLPIFIVILAGLIEVSQLVITQNRVSQAARVSSRFGANGGQNDGMAVVALNSITQTLQMDEDQWDMWAVRGEIDSSGTAFVPGTWEFEHVYGISNTIRFSDIDETTIQNEMLGNLQTNGLPSAGIKVVGLYALHDVESILGLDALPFLDDLYTIQGHNLMRQLGDVVEQTNGCSAFPIAVQEGIRSVTPPGTGGSPYPNANEFDNNSPPAYGDFPNHRPDIPLADALEGDVYYVQQGFGNGNFGWLTWNGGINASATTLNGSLSWPGDSLDYADHGDGGQPAAPGPYPNVSTYPHVVRGYVNPDDTSDFDMNIGDWVAVNTGSINSNAVRTTLEDHFTKGRTLRLIIWNNSRNPGVNGHYQIAGFAEFKLHGYHLSQGGSGQSWILAEFIRWDNSCGQALPTGP